ncbi:DUF4159 domain-containing protein [Psychroflexus sp. CAK57W]|uniref:DUF4159 domain-containing protein n=1 Tax=Psychroflexus curvus TaxID=2873595 RepID=UPI001CCB2974|nr:DUF4159 domain-containing protein [Psychroflexus curvus]MBZ9786680.1 DUF4159 domain-containing protein [Psychroflexus curvus]
MRLILFLVLILSIGYLKAQEIALLKYDGGGDWYSNPTSLPNLIEFTNQTTGSKISKTIKEVMPDDQELFNFPFVHLTGHGNIFFSDKAATNLRNYLLSGGFLHADDNYGLRPYFEEAIKKVFPDRKLKKLSNSHPIFNTEFKFENGLPKIHEHDGKPAEAFGIENDNGRLMVLFTYESDLGNGWEDPTVHGDPEEIRLEALKMGTNLLKYAFNE